MYISIFMSHSSDYVKTLMVEALQCCRIHRVRDSVQGNQEELEVPPLLCAEYDHANMKDLIEACVSRFAKI